MDTKNATSVSKDSNTTLEYWVFNSTRNLAQRGKGNELTKKKAVTYLEINLGNGARHLPSVGYFQGRNRLDAMEMARCCVSPYHHVAVTWEQPNDDEAILADAIENLRFKCSCHFFSRNAVYCEHILVICHWKGIIDVNEEIKHLAPVRSAGRPKKNHFMMKPNDDEEDNIVNSPAQLIGEQTYSDIHGLGFVQAFEGNNSWMVQFPQAGKVTSVFVRICTYES